MMKKMLLTVICLSLLLMKPSDGFSQEKVELLERKVIKAPQRPSVQLPQGFGRPIQRPQGFGKQEWQRPQQRQLTPNHNWNRGSVIIYNPYRYRYVHPHPVYQNWNNFYRPAYPVYPAYPVQPYFFFQFRW